MKDNLEKFQQLEREISQKRGDFYLFALFLRQDAQDKWDLLVAAPWTEKKQKEEFDYLARELQDRFDPKELIKLSRIVIISNDNPALEAINQTIHVEHGLADIQDSNFFGLPIEHAYIITSKSPDVGIETPAM